MRAASVAINDVSGVAGFVQPNDTVDVLVTRMIPGGAGNAQVTDVLLQNVRVIALDQQSKNADGTPKVAKTATLEVSPLDAQKLAAPRPPLPPGYPAPGVRRCAAAPPADCGRCG